MILLFAAALAGAPAPGCPTVTTDPPRCPAGSPLGTSIDTPYEWGPAASGMQPWWGRLSCADGRIPVFRRHGAAGSPKTPSTSPASGEPNLGTADVVDAWEIGCPEARYQLYTNVYRCGNACVPPALSVLPGAALKHLEAAKIAAKKGDVATALAEARAGTDSAPEHERAWVFRGTLAEELGRFDEALVAWEGVVRRFAGSLSDSHRAEALARVGRKDEARELAATLMASAPDGPARPRLLCVQSLVQPDAAKAKTLAGQACAEGYQRCCGG